MRLTFYIMVVSNGEKAQQCKPYVSILHRTAEYWCFRIQAFLLHFRLLFCVYFPHYSLHADTHESFDGMFMFNGSFILPMRIAADIILFANQMRDLYSNSSNIRARICSALFKSTRKTFWMKQKTKTKIAPPGGCVERLN